MATDCSKHPKDILGETDMKLLAKMIANLHYESLAELITFLSVEIYDDGFEDKQAGRKELARELYFGSMHLKDAADNFESAYYISKPFMTENKNQK